MANGTPPPAYRRGSVSGALLLIALGGLFLYSNLHPEFSAWPLLAKYWPVLIIFWGLGKLVDYLVLRGTPAAVAATRLNAGDIIGLLFLLLLGTILSRTVNSEWWKTGRIRIGGEDVGCLMGSEYEFSDQIRQIVKPPLTLTLSNPRGNLTLTPATGNEIQLVSRKKVCAGSEAEARQLAADYRLVFESVPGGYDLRWETPSGPADGLQGADVTLQVPKGVSVKLSTRRGDVVVTGIKGDVEANLERGDAKIEDVEGSVSVDLRKGSARLARVSGDARVQGRGDEVSFRDIRGSASLDGEFYGPIRFSAISGPARFTSRRTTFHAARIDGEMTVDSGDLHLRRVPGDVNLVTRDKDVEMEEVTGGVKIENRDGPVVLRYRTAPLREIDVTTRSADIELYLPASSGFQINATARDGEIESDFSGPGLSLQQPEHGPKVLSGTYGSRRTSIQLTTTYGTIHLRRAGAAPAAPPAPPAPPSPSAVPRSPSTRTVP